MSQTLNLYGYIHAVLKIREDFDSICKHQKNGLKFSPGHLCSCSSKSNLISGTCLKKMFKHWISCPIVFWPWAWHIGSQWLMHSRPRDFNGYMNAVKPNRPYKAWMRILRVHVKHCRGRCLSWFSIQSVLLRDTPELPKCLICILVIRFLKHSPHPF